MNVLSVFSDSHSPLSSTRKLFDIPQQQISCVVLTALPATDEMTKDNASQQVSTDTRDTEGRGLGGERREGGSS